MRTLLSVIRRIDNGGRDRPELSKAPISQQQSDSELHELVLDAEADYRFVVHSDEQSIAWFLSFGSQIRCNSNFTDSVGYYGKILTFYEEDETSPEETLLRVDDYLSRRELSPYRLTRIMSHGGWLFSRQVRVDVFFPACLEILEDLRELHQSGARGLAFGVAYGQLVVRAAADWGHTVRSAFPRAVRWAMGGVGLGLARIGLKTIG